MGQSSLARHGVIIGFLAASSFLIAHTVNAFIEHALFIAPASAPMPSNKESRPELSSQGTEDNNEMILRGGLFLLPQTSETVALAGEQKSTLPPLNLPSKLVLRGTTLGQGRLSSAILEEVSSKRQALYHLGDHIPDVGELADVQRSGVLIRQGPQEEFLPVRLTENSTPGQLSGAVPIRTSLPNTKTRFVLDRQEVAAAMSDLSKLLSQARATPYFVDGKVAGFQIVPVTTDSFFTKIGLIAGDILQRVNGAEVRDPGQVLSLFQQVKQERNVKVDVLRQGQPTTLTYEIR